MEHELKTWEAYFQSIKSGDKNFELRRNDRDFKVGDTLLLKEYDRNGKIYTGRKVRCRINYILKDAEAEEFGLKEGYCIMGLDRI